MRRDTCKSITVSLYFVVDFMNIRLPGKLARSSTARFSTGRNKSNDRRNGSRSRLFRSHTRKKGGVKQVR